MKRSAIFAFCLLVAAAAFAQEQDRRFADAMIQHHQDGIRMAEMAVDNAQSADVRAIARKMINKQSQEILQLKTLRGEAPMTPEHAIHQFPGMMSDSEMQRDMARLESARGEAFDLAFTELMAKHHQGGVRMAQHEMANGENGALVEMARRIAENQSEERQTLLTMRQDLGLQPMTSSAPERQRLMKD